MPTITEIIPDDLPDWAIKAFAEGQLFHRLNELISEGREEGYKAGYKAASECGSIYEK